MADGRNTVTDYLAQRKKGVGTSGTSARFSSQRPIVYRAPPRVSRTTSASASESPRSSSSPPSTPRDDSEVPETQSSRNVLSRMTLEDLLNIPGRNSLPKLVPPSKHAEDPDGAWFHLTHGVARNIREILEGDYKEAYHNIIVTPQDVQDRWFKSFAQRFDWDIVHTDMVRGKFTTQFGKQLCGLVSDWKARMKKLAWMGETVWESLLEHWASEGHQAVSARNSKARNSKKDDIGSPVHCMGQKSFLRRAHEMKSPTGEPPSRLEVLVDTHKRKFDGVIIDPRTFKLVEEVNNKVAEQLSQMAEDGDDSDTPRVPTTEQIDELFKKTVPIKRGRWYGMGSASDCIGSSSSFTPSHVVTTLQSQLQSTQAELHATKLLVTQQQSEFLAQMKLMKEDYEKRFKDVEDRLPQSN